MIKNERQYKITKSQFNLLKEAIGSYDIDKKIQQIGSEILAKAELESLKCDVEILENQLNEYEALKSGVRSILTASSLAELPRVLIQARIAQKLSQKELAALLDIKEQQIQRYEAEEYKSASLKRLIEVAEALHLNVSGIAEINKFYNQAIPNLRYSVDWKRFPIKEMYKRGWFEGFPGSIDEALQESVELLQNYVSYIYKRPALSLHRKHVRINSNLDEYALLAWECRVLHLATKVSVSKYKEELLTSEWISQLVKLSKFHDGPRRAIEMLEHAGIVVIIEPMLSNTYLDGGAFLYKDIPVIGLTLRYDRMDNFWFVLLHEIAHVVKHLGKQKVNRIFDDLDVLNTERLECEADYFANESLIPSSEWDKAIARFTRSERSINDLANKLSISPAIIAGRIRYEANNYVILNDLVEHGSVRKQFPDVIFGI